MKMQIIKPPKKQDHYTVEIVHKVQIKTMLIIINLKKNKIGKIIQLVNNKLRVIKRRANRSQRNKGRRSRRKRLTRMSSSLLSRVSLMRRLIVKLMKVIPIIWGLNPSNPRKVKGHSQRAKLMNKTQTNLVKEIKRNLIFLKQRYQKNHHKIRSKYHQTNRKSSQGMKIITQSIQ